MQKAVLAEQIKQGFLKWYWFSKDTVASESILKLLGPLPEEGQQLLLRKLTAAARSYWAEMMHRNRGTVTQEQRRLHHIAVLARKLHNQFLSEDPSDPDNPSELMSRISQRTGVDLPVELATVLHRELPKNPPQPHLYLANWVVGLSRVAEAATRAAQNLKNHLAKTHGSNRHKGQPTATTQLIRSLIDLYLELHQQYADQVPSPSVGPKGALVRFITAAMGAIDTTLPTWMTPEAIVMQCQRHSGLRSFRSASNTSKHGEP